MLDGLLEKLFGSRRKYLLPTGSSSAARSRVQAPHVRSGIRRVFGMKPGGRSQRRIGENDFERIGTAGPNTDAFGRLSADLGR